MREIPVSRRCVLGLATLAASLGSLAQGKPGVPRIGVLWTGRGPNNPQAAELMQRFRDELAKAGRVEGRNLVIETRFVGDGLQPSREIAQLLALKVDVIVATSTPIAVTASNMTGSVAIVFAVLGDPVQLGLVDTIARPGRNLTGIYTSAPDQAGKRLQLLHEAVRGGGKLGALWLRGSPVGLELRLTRGAADKLGVQLVDLTADAIEEFDTLLPAARKSGVAGVTLMTQTRVRIHQQRLASMLSRHKLPSIAVHADYVHLGGLMSYGPSATETLNRLAEGVSKVLAGRRPATLPVEQNARFGLALNMTTARAVGVVFPKALLAYADNVVP